MAELPPVPAEVQGPQASPTAPEAAPATQAEAPAAESTPQVNIYDISGHEPVLGQIHPDEVTEAVASGKYSLPQGEHIQVVSPDGTLGTLDPAEAPQAFQNGFKYATPTDIESIQYGGGLEQLKAGVEGLAKGFAGPVATGAETLLLDNAKEQAARARANPGTHYGTEALGLGAGIFTGTGEAAVAAKLGELGASAAGLAEGASVASRLGSAAVKGFIENAAIQGGDEVSKLIWKDPGHGVGSALMDIGLAGALGGVIGGAAGGAGELWKATVGAKTGSILNQVADRVGGVESQELTAIDTLASKAGMDLAPEVRAAINGNPETREMFSTLSQSDTTKAGKSFQATLEDTRKEAGDIMARTLGREPEAVRPISETSKYEHGKSLTDTLASEFDEKTAPLGKQYDEFNNKFKGKDLEPSVSEKADAISAQLNKAQGQMERLTRQAVKAQEAGSPEKALEAFAKLEEVKIEIKGLQAAAKAPGTSDILVQKIGNLAQKEGWLASPSSDIMREVNRVVKELPNLKTLNDLTNYIKRVGENTASKLPFGMQDPVSRAGGMIKSILRDSEAELIGRHIGSEEGVAALEQYQALRKAYAGQAALKEAINDRLKVGGSTSGFAKTLRAAGQSEGEKMLQRLTSGKDSELLQILQKNFPKTADAVQKFKLDELISGARETNGAINTTKLAKGLANLSPEMRKFLVPSEEALQRVGAISDVLEKLKDPKHNFSNTARTVDKLFSYLPGSALGIAAMVAGHNPVAGLLLAGLAKTLAKDAPDSLRLATLKFLGSNRPVSASAFKSAVEFIQSTAKGENLLAKGTKALFTAGREVLPESFHPSEAERTKLDKAVAALQKDPMKMANLGGNLGHYMPEHTDALSATATRAVAYLAKLRPDEESRRLPLDGKLPASAAAKANYNSALNIAQQPLTVLSKAKVGSLTPSDVGHLKAMYPEVHARMSQKVMSEMATAADKGEIIPYKTRIGLSLLLGQAVDSSLTPASILAAQPKPKPNEQAPGMNGSAPSKPGALAKLPSTYMTPNQQRQKAAAEGNHR